MNSPECTAVRAAFNRMIASAGAVHQGRKLATISISLARWSRIGRHFASLKPGSLAHRHLSPQPECTDSSGSETQSDLTQRHCTPLIHVPHQRCGAFFSCRFN